MFSLFGLGLLLGFQHALEADHVAAVTALTRRGLTARQATAYGASWGFGHAITLLAFGSVVVLFGFDLPDGVASWLEFAVGIMLLFLGGKLIYGVLRRRLHIHGHRHEDGRYHIHVHSHAHEVSKHHKESNHDHEHRELKLVDLAKPLSVGIMHGMAGTAALIVLITATTLDSKLHALGYIAVFGFGSVVGMAVLSVAISYPTTWLERNAPRLSAGVNLSLGVATVVIGGVIASANWS